MAWRSAAILLTAVIVAIPTSSQVSISPSNTAPANPAPLPAVAPRGRPVVGVALEGGGALGLAHIGVLQWMEENHIPIDRLAGTSMGALVGGLYASGLTPAELRALATSDAFTGVFTLQSPYSDLSYRRRQDRHEIPQGITVGLKHGPLLSNALLTDRGVSEFLINNLPTDVVRRDLHAEIVIAIHLETSPIAASDTNSIVGVLNRAFTAGIELNSAQARALADLVVSVPFDKLSGTDYAKGGQIIRAGYLAAEQNRAALLRYALNDNDWKIYLAARQARMLPQPGTLRQVKVEGASPSAVRSVLANLKPLDGQPVAPITTINALKPIQSNGGYDATFETFSPALAAGSTAARTPGASPNDAGILVRLSKDSIGPPYLVIGPELTAATSNITRMEINLRFVDQNFRGFGSELRGTAELGYKTVLTAEYYRRLTPGGFFLQPRATVSREPVFIWANQKRIAERFQQNLVAGLEVGRTFGNTKQVSAEWRAADVRWGLRTGSGGGPYLTGTAQTGLLHFNLDKAASGTISPSGFRFAASAGALYHAVGSSNAPMAQFSFSRTFPFKHDNIIGMSLEVDSYLRANVAQPYRFTLGGPMRLSASAFDEYRGTDLYLARSGYMHRLAALPTGLGQGLYGLIGYEAGEVWSPEQRAFLRQNGTVGLVGNTPLGLVTFGVSVGDAGHRKVFITLGRWF